LTTWVRGVRDDLGDVAGVDWVLGIGVLTVAGLIAVWLRRRAAASIETATRRLESEQAVSAADGAARRFSTRVNILLCRLIRDLAILLPFFLALGVVAWAAALPPHRAQPIAWFLGLVVIIVVLIRLAHHAFDTAVPVHRVVPCSDTVARHCRRTCIAALVLGLLFLPLLALLFFLRTAPGIQSLLAEVFKAGFLLILLGFVSRRARLADLLGGSRADWKHILVSAMHPILFLLVLALLVMQILGYGMLVGFVGRGLLASLAIIVIVSVIVEYLCDLVEKLGPTVSFELASDATRPLDAADGESAESLVPSGGYLVRLFKTLLRLAGSVTALILILHMWVGDSYWAWFDWKICAILAIVVVAALLVDRVLFTALKAVVASGRLPESTSSIIRRWVRGLLSAVVLLIVVTMAGYRIESLWAPLSALLAMVAVGFVAVWSLLSNILATLMILVWRPFNVGERVDIQPEGISGEVIDINFMYTLLKTEDGGRITVPNSQFVQKFVKRTKAVGSPVRSLAEQLESEKPVGD
ncbi:MAG: mechanosensitive ion channel family protein, partial [Phycisphaerales bacterium]